MNFCYTQVIFFEFQSKEEGKNKLSLHLDSKIFSASDERTTILNSLHVKLQKDGNIWVIPDQTPPLLFRRPKH